DPEAYKEYIALNAVAVRKFGARFLGRAAPPELKEGTARARNVVIEFPTYQAALDCFNSAEYQKALAVRRPVSSADMIIIEGYEGPQPS
ncbi:MAG: DUF1330 domain-containing protein, partial [Beijerinckiaceae bacterium]